MKQFLIRRLLLAILILFGAAFVIYSIIRLMPADYIDVATASIKELTPEMKDNLRKLYGLDTGIIEGFFKWFSKAITGDLGESFIYKKAVATVIGDNIWYSFFLNLPSTILSTLIAVPMGIIAAVKQYSKTDYVLTAIAVIGISMPTFFFASLLQRILCMELGIFPFSGMVDARADYQGFMKFLDLAYHFALPIIMFTILSIGGTMRFVRTNMLEVLNADYIRTARAKGLSEHKVIYTHAFRNTLIPLITSLAGVLPSLFSGAMITEQIFSIQGVGFVSLKAIQSGDVPLMMGFSIFSAALMLIGFLLADIAYAMADPRVRLS